MILLWDHSVKEGAQHLIFRISRGEKFSMAIVAKVGKLAH